MPEYGTSEAQSAKLVLQNGNCLDLSHKPLWRRVARATKSAVDRSHICQRNPLKIANRICQFSQYLDTKLDMLFKIAKSVKIVRILGKISILR